MTPTSLVRLALLALVPSLAMADEPDDFVAAALGRAIVGPRQSLEDARAFVYLTPEPGTLFLWESWLRHEVPANRARAERVSISFNYGWR